MLTRGWRRLLAFLTALIALLRSADNALAAHDFHDDETSEDEGAVFVQAQSVEQAPPPVPSMPIAHRFVHTEPQRSARRTPPDDNWWMGMPLTLQMPPGQLERGDV